MADSTASAKKSSLLRAALEALSQGNYAEAIVCSKHALKQDRHSYDALLVLGKALFSSKQLDQAEIPYRRAAELNPDDVRAWRGLIELYEAIGNHKKVVEACDTVISLYHAIGNQTHLNDYRRRLATAYAALAEHEKALRYWETFLVDSSLSEPLYLEVLCGTIDAKTAIMENCIQNVYNRYLTEDNGLDKSLARQNAENEWLSSGEHIKMEEMLLEVLNRRPYSEKYEALLLQLLVWRMRTHSPTKGKGWHDLCKQVLKLCLSSLQWHATSDALVLLLALCDEDRVEDLFNDVGMLELNCARKDRFQILGQRLAHAYPNQDLVISVLVFIMHQSSSCSVSLASKRLLCEYALRSNENSIIGWQVLAELRVLEGAYSSASECVKRGLQVINIFRSSYGLSLEYAELHLRLVLGDSLLKSGNYEEASLIFQKIEEALQGNKDTEASSILVSAMEGQVRAHRSTGDNEKASMTLVTLLNLDNKNSWALAEQGWIAYQKRDFEQAINLMEQAVNLNPESACYHYRLGLAYLTSNISQEYIDKSLLHLLESAKLDCSQPEVFRVLGDYYRNQPNGAKRAVRCYQKAVLLNCEDADAGESLCALLDDEGDVFLELTTCRESSQKSPRSFWAFRRLGYLQINRRQWSDAAKNLQHAVRGYPDCPDVWEALALSYQQLGMLTAALKAYSRVINLQKNPLFSLQQSGNVLLILGLYRKAVTMFQTALEISPEHPASMYGLASALFGQASECRSIGAIRWSASLLQEAIVVASCGIQRCANLTSFWKLLGDIKISYARNLPWQLFAGMSNTSSSSQIGATSAEILRTFNSSMKAWNNERIMAAREARKAYQHALHLQPDKGNLYSDLCLALNMIHNLDRESWTISKEAVALCGLALEGSNADLWTTLGVTARDKGVRQHALIQALHVNGDHALAWAELGQLYLKAGEHELAKEAFTRSRSVDPSLALTWAAMANMCDMSRQDQMQEAYANILYAAQLLPVVDFQLGLAKTALITHQLDSEQVYVAVDQAVLQAPQRPEVHNLKGLLCELRGDYSSAIRAFQTSRAALENLAFLNPDSIDVKRSAVTINLARCLCKAGDANNAVEEYECLVESGNIEDIKVLRGYVTALWQQGKQKLALVLLKKSMEVAAKSSMKNFAATQLLAKFTYFMTGPSAALEELYCCGIDMNSETGLLCTACAIASAVGRYDILLRLMSEGGVYYNHQQAVEFVLLAVASVELSKDVLCDIGLSNNILLLQKTIHMHPESLKARMKLMQLLLDRSHGIEIGLAARCCSLTSFSNLSKASEMNGFPQIWGAIALACNVCGGINSQCSFTACKSSTYSCIRELQRCLHLEPWNLMTHYQLVLSLMQQAREQKFPVNSCLMLQHMAEIVLSRVNMNATTNGGIKEYMQLQLMLCCSECALHSGRSELAVDIATSASSLKLPADICLLPLLQLVRCHAVNQNKALVDEVLQKVHELDALDLPIWVCVLNVLSSIRRDDARSYMPRIQLPKYHQIPDALLQWKQAEKYIQEGDMSSAEKAALDAVTLWPDMAALHLFHGAICIELKERGCTEYLLHGSRRLMRIMSAAVSRLPIAGILLAQAQPDKASTPGWERLICTEWSLWPPGSPPAELYFHMGLLTKMSGVCNVNTTEVSDTQSPRVWFRKAVHINPSCARYWTMMTETGTMDNDDRDRNKRPQYTAD